MTPPPLFWFEFMDVAGLPESLRLTVREALECGMGAPFRDYADWVCLETLRVAKEQRCDAIIEMGAGTAPLARRLVRNPDLGNVQVVVCDLHPDRDTYQALAREHSGKIRPIFESVDMMKEHSFASFGQRQMLVLSASFHHIPPAARIKTLRALLASAPHVLIFEPLRRTLESLIYGPTVFSTALLSPLVFIRRHGLHREGHWRRIFWTWFVPLAPIMLAWDGFVSAARMWTAQEWHEAFESIYGKVGSLPQVYENGHTQLVHCTRPPDGPGA